MTALHALPDPPDLDDDDLVDTIVSDAVADLARAYGMSTRDMVRWIVDDHGPEGLDLEPPEGASGAVSGDAMAWRITSDAEAEWALQRLDSARSALAAVAGQADDFRLPLQERLRRVDEWERNASRTSLATARYMAAHLERWARIVRDSSGRKSVQLPSGRVETRATGEHVSIVDQEKVADQVDAWRLDVEVRTRRQVDARQLKGAVRPAWLHFAELSCGHTVELGVDIVLPPLDGPGAQCGQCATADEMQAGVEPYREVRHFIASRVAVFEAEGRLHVLDGVEVVPERITTTVHTDHLEPPRFQPLD